MGNVGLYGKRQMHMITPFIRRCFGSYISGAVNFATLALVVLAVGVNAVGCGQRHEYTEEGNKFCWAVNENKIEEAKSMLKANPKLVYSIWKLKGWSPLFCAIRSEQKETVEWLLANGADVNYAIKDPEKRKDWNGVDGQTPLFAAIDFGREDTDIVKLLLKHGAQINIKATDGETPLHHAVTKQNKRMVEVLLSNGADVNAKDNSGKMPLTLALMFASTYAGVEPSLHKQLLDIADLLRKNGGRDK